VLSEGGKNLDKQVSRGLVEKKRRKEKQEDWRAKEKGEKGR